MNRLLAHEWGRDLIRKAVFIDFTSSIASVCGKNLEGTFFPHPTKKIANFPNSYCLKSLVKFTTHLALTHCNKCAISFTACYVLTRFVSSFLGRRIFHIHMEKKNFLEDFWKFFVKFLLRKERNSNRLEYFGLLRISTDFWNIWKMKHSMIFNFQRNASKF